MIVLICSGGPSEELCSLEPFLHREDVFFIGADKGAATLFALGVVPNIMIGDFDSIDESTFEQLKKQVPIVVRAAAEKDETDTDLALNYALTLKPTSIILTGVTGGRLDHEEAAKRSLLRIQLQTPAILCEIRGKKNKLRYLVEANKSYKLDKNAQYVSFFAFTEAIREVTLKGVKYPAKQLPMSIMSSLFTSNEVVNSDASITFSNGICMMIESDD